MKLYAIVNKKDKKINAKDIYSSKDIKDIVLSKDEMKVELEVRIKG